MIRDDLTNRLVHLTRGEPDEVAAQAFLSIVSERRIRGGTGCIKGGFKCVCFSEAPLSKLAPLLANSMAHGMRYKPFGVMVGKSWLFDKGGRPAIYQPESEYPLLHESQRFRHVRFEPESVDFTWEREWRLQADDLPIEPDSCTLVVPTRAWEKWAQDAHVAGLARRALLLNGLIGPRSVTEFPWHFVVLEDLGVEMPAVAPPPSA